jgi:hypothetical protein
MQVSSELAASLRAFCAAPVEESVRATQEMCARLVALFDVRHGLYGVLFSGLASLTKEQLAPRPQI